MIFNHGHLKAWDHSTNTQLTKLVRTTDSVTRRCPCGMSPHWHRRVPSAIHHSRGTVIDRDRKTKLKHEAFTNEISHTSNSALRNYWTTPYFPLYTFLFVRNSFIRKIKRIDDVEHVDTIIMIIGEKRNVPNSKHTVKKIPPWV